MYTNKREALALLEERIANRPEQIDDSKLHAGSPMHFYCVRCGHLSDTLPEMYTWPPKKLCKECQNLKDLGWLE